MNAKKTHLSVGSTKMDIWLDGGLALGETTYWSSLVHNFRSGTALNLLVGAIGHNPGNPEKPNLAVLYGTEEDESMVYSMLYRMLKLVVDNEVVTKWPELDAMAGWVQHIAREAGWVIHIAPYTRIVHHTEDPVKQSQTAVDYIRSTIADANKQHNSQCKLVLIDNVDMIRGPVPLANFTAQLGSLAKLFGAHVSAFNQLGSDARALYRDLADPTMFLKVVSRTGYVPRSLRDRSDRQIVIQVLSKDRAGFTVGYHMANEKHSEGMVVMDVHPSIVYADFGRK